MHYAKDDEVLYHIGLSKNTIEKAEYAILINDKKYIEAIAKILDPNAKYINENREYFTYLATFNSQKVAVVSTGLGGPAMGIGLEEMAMIGLKYFIRLGEVGALQFNMNIGDLLISKASMRYEGTSTHYAPETYPAVADLEMTNTFEEVFIEKKLIYHFGVTVTTDTFWAAQARTSGYLSYVPVKYRDVQHEWRKLNLLGVEMELATLFTLCNVFNLEAVAVLDVSNRNFESDEIPELDDNARIKRWKSFLPDCIKKDMDNKGL